MSEYQFKVGAKVKVYSQEDLYEPLDKLEGIIKEVHDEDWIGIEFNSSIPNGHSIGGLGKDEHCFYIPKNQIVALTGD